MCILSSRNMIQESTKFENSTVTENIKDIYYSKALNDNFIFAHKVLFLKEVISPKLNPQFVSYYQERTQCISVKYRPISDVYNQRLRTNHAMGKMITYTVSTR
jgi:hypothetical protein